MTVGKYEILSSVIDIIKTLQAQVTNGKLAQVREKGTEVQVTCPFHKEGMERRPSCYIREDGVFHCFTCNESGTLDKFIAEVKGCSVETAQQWLIDTFGGVYSKPKYKLKDIVLPTVKPKEYLNESILDTYEPYHPYMTQRRISDEVIKEFQIKYNPKTKSIVFPVRDKYGKLIAMTQRSVEDKQFLIDADFNKTNLYGLDKINYSKPVYLVESQINCLTLFSYGKQALALYGATCTESQIECLNKLPIKSYIIAFDNDVAGRHGTVKLCQYLNNSKMVEVVMFNDSRDVNDLTEDEFNSLKIYERHDFLNMIK